MSDTNKYNLEGKEVPFFARYLESESYEDLSEKESEGIRGGAQISTAKAPSDSDEVGGGDFLTRIKDRYLPYPKYPGRFKAVTLKAPSDSDEVG